MPAAATPAIALLIRARIDHRVHEYALPERHGSARGERPEYGLEAAAALDIDPARMGKTLVAAVDGRLVAAVVAVDRQVDLKALASVVGGRHAELADPAAAERAAGSVIGGISPLGMRRPLPVVVDAALLAHPTIVVSAGRRGLQIELAPGDLIAAADAVVGIIARPL